MRIIAGTYGGRQLVAPKTRGTRPMTDKTREALFSALGSLEGLSVLDAYAGSGALGFEALSRGAQQVVAVEMGQAAVQSIRTNLKALDVSWSYTLEEKRVESWLAQSPQQRFDLIFAMPPYAVLDRELLSRLGALLNRDGVMVVEYPRQVKDYQLEGLTVIEARSYGDPTLGFYKPA